jgi:hypothetical protein
LLKEFKSPPPGGFRGFNLMTLSRPPPGTVGNGFVKIYFFPGVKKLTLKRNTGITYKENVYCINISNG